MRAACQPIWCLATVSIALLLCTSSCGAAEAEASSKSDRPALFLSQRDDQFKIMELKNSVIGGMMAREFFRQGLLVAARDELGLRTLDGSLGESAPTTTGALLTMSVLAEQSDKDVEFLVWRVEGNNRTEALSGKAAVLTNEFINGFDYRRALEVSEELSRTAFIELCKTAIASPKPNRELDTSELPESIVRLLGEMNWLSQFMAVRQLHSTIHEQGESPELLGALVRAYVNLGVLSETHWHTTHKAYKARALVYAQRLVVRQKSDAWSLWHRAYAWALVGRHSDALADLVAAKAAKKEESTPPWVPLIDAYCKYDLPVLRVATTEESAPELNWLLAYLATLSAGTPHLTIEMGLKSVTAVPRCYRIYDDLSTIGGVALHHETTVRSLLMLGETLYSDLSTLSGSPASVASAIEQIIPQLKASDEKIDEEEGDSNGRVLRELSLRGGLVSALIDAEPSDTAEPSTGALAHLIVEENFKQVWTRARFLYRELGVPTTGFLTIVQPIVERHPYQGLLAAFNTDDLERQSLTESVRQVRTDIHESQQRAMHNEISEFDFQKAVELHKYMEFNRDVVTRDVEFFSVNDSPNNSLSGKWFRAISPHSPRGIACRIEAITFIESENERGKWREWERQFHSFPIVLRTLAEAYLKENKTVDAERCLVDYVKSSPEYWAYQTLADIYQGRGETDRWQETLESFLEQPSYGLEPARVRVTLAEHFMERGERDRAVEYADAAAQTGAAWAMLCASQCHEARGDWEESEEWVRLTSERYRGQGTKWYDWCLRTGRGNREPARELAIAAASRLVQTNDSGWFLKLGLYHLVDGDDPRARSMFKVAYERAGGAYVGMQVVLLSDVLKKLDDRNKALKAVLEAPAKDAPGKAMPDEFMEFASLLGKLPLEQTFRPSAADVDPLLDRAEPSAKSNIAYFVGRWSKLAGNWDEAKRYFTIAATHGHPDQQSRVHARILLSQLDKVLNSTDVNQDSTPNPPE